MSAIITIASHNVLSLFILKTLKHNTTQTISLLLRHNKVPDPCNWGLLVLQGHYAASLYLYLDY